MPDRMTPGALRKVVFERDGGCVWPGCEYEISGFNPLQLAHLTHRGMGGSTLRNTEDNAVALCAIHHDTLDGRTGQVKHRGEIVAMLRKVVGL